MQEAHSCTKYMLLPRKCSCQNETSVYPYRMQTKLIGAVVLIILLAIGGYFAWGWMSSKDTPADTAQNTNTPDPNLPQVQGQDVTIGTGAEAGPGSVVSILYVGMLEDGTVFDSSANNNNQPLVFQLGAEGIIPGFQIGVNGMKEGGERRISIPSALGYGTEGVKDAAGTQIIPGNATLVFDVRLVKVEPAPAATPAAQ